MLVYFAWLANRNKSRLKSSDIKFCLIAIVECLVLLVCSVTISFWTANMPQCVFQVCQCTHELTVCVLCCFWTIKNKKNYGAYFNQTNVSAIEKQTIKWRWSAKRKAVFPVIRTWTIGSDLVWPPCDVSLLPRIGFGDYTDLLWWNNIHK